MSNLTVNVEFLAGTTINEAIKEAKEKAQALNVCYITFKFNGKSLSVSQRANVKKMTEEYKTKKKYIIG